MPSAARIRGLPNTYLNWHRRRRRPFPFALSEITPEIAQKYVGQAVQVWINQENGEKTSIDAETQLVLDNVSRGFFLRLFDMVGGSPITEFMVGFMLYIQDLPQPSVVTAESAQVVGHR
jgi:hypothetical protein